MLQSGGKAGIDKMFDVLCDKVNSWNSVPFVESATISSDASIGIGPVYLNIGASASVHSILAYKATLPVK